MKKMQQVKSRNWRGFTLLEMLIVLCVIAVLILLFLPNISTHKATIDKKGDEALVKVVHTQAEIYRIDEGKEPTLEILKKEGYLTEDQYKKAVDKKIDVKEKTNESQP